MTDYAAQLIADAIRYLGDKLVEASQSSVVNLEDLVKDERSSDSPDI